MSARQQVTDEQIAAAVFIYGTQKAAAEVLQISPHALLQRIQLRPKLRKLMAKRRMPRKYTNEQIVDAIDCSASLRDATCLLMGREPARRNISLSVIYNRASEPAVAAAMARLRYRQREATRLRQGAERERRDARRSVRQMEQKCRAQLRTWSGGRDAFILQWGGQVTNKFLGDLFGISRERVRQIRSDE